MKTAHLTEAQLQNHADGSEILEDSASQHLSKCRYCQSQLDNYLLIVEALRDMSRTTFEFNLAELVPVEYNKKKVTLHWIAIAAATFGACLVVLAAGHYGMQFLSLIAAPSTAQSYILSLPLITFFLTQCAVQFVRHQQKLNSVLRNQKRIATEC